MLSVAVLRSSFAEPSVQVRGAMWRPLLKFLKGTLWLGFFVVISIRILITLQIFHAHGRLMLPSIPRKRTRVGPMRKTMIREEKRKQMHKRFLHKFPKTCDHPVSRTFCSSWSLVVVVRLCRATRQSSLFFPQSRLPFVSISTLLLTIH